MIRSKEVDLRHADGYRANFTEAVLKQLTDDGFFGPQFLYRAFPGDMSSFVVKRGTDLIEGEKSLDTLFASTDTELAMGENSSQSAIYYMVNQEDRLKKSGLSVYDASKMEREIEYEWRFREPGRKLDALMAIYLFQLPE